MKLILWDIDGTLICSGRAGERALVTALKVCFGVEGTLRAIDYFGRTDVLISRMLFEHYHVPWSLDNQQRYLEAYLRELAKEMPLGPAKTHPGVLGLIEVIKGRPGIVQGLLTGNIVDGARIKLEYFGVWQYFEFGAFANDSHIRNELGPFALQRAKDRHGQDFNPKDVYIVGDTPHDIACAKVIGANSIAVATGHFSVEQLRDHQPTALLTDLSDPDAFLALIERPSS